MGLSRSQITTSATRFATARREALGIPLVFRGVTISGIVSESMSPISLGEGGFSESATYTILLPASIQPAPRLRETILEPTTGRTFHITGVHTTPASSPLAAEHRLTAALA